MVSKRSAPRKGKPQGGAMPPPSDKTRWAYHMNGINPDCDDAGAVDRITAAFGRQHPAWLIASNPARKITGTAFRTLRHDVLRLTREEAAAYLRVSTRTVAAWETDASPVPFSAVETFRLLAESTAFRLSHRAWDGWFINHKTGGLISPDVGRLEVFPAEINALSRLYTDRDFHKAETERLRRQLEEAKAENTRLRTLYLADGVTDELRTMHDRLTGLLGRIGTARIIDFPSSNEASIPTRKVDAL